MSTIWENDQQTKQTISKPDLKKSHLPVISSKQNVLLAFYLILPHLLSSHHAIVNFLSGTVASDNNKHDKANISDDEGNLP